MKANIDGSKRLNNPASRTALTTRLPLAVKRIAAAGSGKPLLTRAYFAGFALTISLSWFITVLAEVNAEAITILNPTLPAAGLNKTLIQVEQFGRYAITATSAQGVALQLVDSMAGPSAVVGQPGKQDGRLDVFLDRGEYRLLTQGHELAKGEVKLAAYSFTEKHELEPTTLPAIEIVSEQLNDFEQSSYWLEVSEGRQVYVEAAGRCLADLRVWRDGAWLTSGEPTRSVIHPREGRPLLLCSLSIYLDPGTYRITAYGGKSQPWSDQAEEYPLHIRLDIPMNPYATRKYQEISEFGFDRYLVPNPTDYFRLELPEPLIASMKIAEFNDTEPFGPGGEIVTINKETKIPVCDLKTDSSSGNDHLVTVSGSAGQPYVFQHFQLWDQNYGSLTGDGSYWLSTVHAGSPEDSIDATAIVVKQERRGGRKLSLAVTQAIELSQSTYWRRRFNLPEQITLYLEVKELGVYLVKTRETTERHRIEPYFITPPDDYRAPQYRWLESRWELDPGFYVFTIEPQNAGIVEVAIIPDSVADFTWDKELPDLSPWPFKPYIVIPAVSLTNSYTYTMYLNNRPDLQTGVVLRNLPLNAEEGLPLALGPNSSLDLPLKVSQAGKLRAIDSYGQALDLATSPAGPGAKELRVRPGSLTVTVSNPSTSAAVFTVDFASAARGKSAPGFPSIGVARLESLQTLDETSPHYFDLGVGASETYLVKIAKPAIYNLQSTGLLRTSGILRTRTVAELYNEAENGVGLNFLIQQYLREGDYQITVSALEETRGRLGLELSQAKTLDGGALLHSVPDRYYVPENTALEYQISIAQAGKYRLKSFGQNQVFRCRLEDADGWPIITPNQPADRTLDLEPGTYRLLLLPEPLPSRRITMVSAVAEYQPKVGHGPHQLYLEKTETGTWTEPKSGEERVPDTWELEVPAPVVATITITGEMGGDLKLKVENAWQQVAIIAAAKVWSGPIGPGQYRLEVACSRKNDLVKYDVAVKPKELVAGVTKSVVAPVRIPVVISSPALIDLSSFGAADVKAVLLDSQGKVLAREDDTDDDWNFRINRQLQPGSYMLDIEPVGNSSARTDITMRTLAEQDSPPAALPLNQSLIPGAKVVVVPISISEPLAPNSMLIVAASSNERAACQIEVRAAYEWVIAGSASGSEVLLEQPLPTALERGAGSVQARLKVWSLEQGLAPILLTAATVQPPTHPESALASGLRLTAVPGIKPPIGIAYVSLTQPGAFKVPLNDGAATIRVSSEPTRACRPCAGETILATATSLWLTADISSSLAARTIHADRISLTSGPTNTVQFPLAHDETAYLNLKPARKGPVVVACSSMLGQAGLRLTSAQNLAEQQDALLMAVAPNLSMAVGLGEVDPAVMLWHAQPEDLGLVEFQLRLYEFEPPHQTPLSYGRLDGKVQANQAQSFTLPSTACTMRLTLSRFLLAVALDRDKPIGVYGGDRDNTYELITDGFSKLMLLNCSAADSSFFVDLLPSAAELEAPALTLNSSFEAYYPTASVVPVLVDLKGLVPGKHVLHVAGANQPPIFLSNNGDVMFGAELLVAGERGRLLIPQATGYVVSWIDEPGAEGQSLLQAAKDKPSKITPPATVALSGTRSSFSFDVKAPTLVHFKAATPMITGVKIGQLTHTQVNMTGPSLDFYLPEGKGSLVVRALKGDQLNGRAEFSVSHAVPLLEGIGPELLLAPGESKLFTFELSQKSTIGLGVRAQSGVVDCVLLDSRGAIKGAGAVIMPTLDAGTYILKASNHPDAAPIRVQPALVGLKPPGSGPPKEVIERYMGAPVAQPAESAELEGGTDE